MKIYKFRDLTNESKNKRFLQIILQKHIWCASPDSLNDENEFKYKLDYRPSQETPDLLRQFLLKFRTTNYSPLDLSVEMILKKNKLATIAEPIIEKLEQNIRNTVGIVSFSLLENDNHLWEEYGGKGNGVCIQIDIPDHLVGQIYHEVQYVSERIFHIDTFLKSSLYSDKAFETYRNILLTKTKKWEKEKEIRFIGGCQNANLEFEGKITKITFGPIVPGLTFNKLVNKIENYCKKNKILILKL